MIRNIVITEQDGMSVRVATITCEVPDKRFDLLAAAKKAADAYCSTGDGYRTLQYNCGCFNWGDFAMYVGNDIANRVGFSIVENSLDDLSVDWDEQILSERVLEAYRKSREV